MELIESVYLNVLNANVLQQNEEYATRKQSSKETSWFSHLRTKVLLETLFRGYLFIFHLGYRGNFFSLSF